MQWKIEKTQIRWFFRCIKIEMYGKNWAFTPHHMIWGGHVINSLLVKIVHHVWMVVESQYILYESSQRKIQQPANLILSGNTCKLYLYPVEIFASWKLAAINSFLDKDQGSIAVMPLRHPHTDPPPLAQTEPVISGDCCHNGIGQVVNLLQHQQSFNICVLFPQQVPGWRKQKIMCGVCAAAPRTSCL